MPIHPNAKQCAYTKVDGKRCGGPAVDGSSFCHHHDGLSKRLQERNFRIPALDDQNSIQVALMDVINALLTRSIDRADAYTVLYAIQIAKSNLKGLTLVPPTPDEVAEQIAAARAEAKAEAERENSDYDENGEPNNLAALLMKELGELREENPDNHETADEKSKREEEWRRAGWKPSKTG